MEKSPLISQELQQQLQQLLDRLTAPVELTCLPGEDEKSREMTCFLNHLVSLSPRLSCRVLAPGQEPELEAAMDGSLLPATGVGAPGEIPRMIFHGVPGGKEITAFAGAILAAGGGAKPLDRATLRDIGKVKAPLDIRVCVSLGCQHCAQLVSHAQRAAWENPRITAHMVDANLYPALVKAHGITRVPVTLVNGKAAFSGGKTMAELTTLLARTF